MTERPRTIALQANIVGTVVPSTLVYISGDSILCKSVVGVTAALLQRAWQTENLFWVLGGKDPAKKEVCVAHIYDVCVFLLFSSPVCCAFFLVHGSGLAPRAAGWSLQFVVISAYLCEIFARGLGCLEGAEPYDTRFRDNKGQDFPPGNQFESRHAVVVHTSSFLKVLLIGERLSYTKMVCLLVPLQHEYSYEYYYRICSAHNRR